MEILAIVVIGAIILGLGIALAPYILPFLGGVLALVVVVGIVLGIWGALTDSGATAEIVHQPPKLPLLEWIDRAPSRSSRRTRMLVVAACFLCPVVAILAFVAAI